MSAELLKALKDVIPLAEHADYPEGDSAKVIDAKSLVLRLESSKPWTRETGWLVERGGNGTPMYRTLEQGLPVWTPDSLKALRFARREDAELFAAEDDDAWLVTEHSWEGPAP